MHGMNSEIERILAERHRAFLLGVAGKNPSHRYRAEFRRLNREYCLLKAGKRAQTNSKRSKPPAPLRKIPPGTMLLQPTLFQAD